jgi:hypothetical protein
MTDKLTDAQAIELDQKNRDQWAKDHPGKPYHSNLTPKQQSMRDAERQEALRQEKQDQATQNNQDRQRTIDNAANAEADAQVKATDELRVDAAKAPLPKPFVQPGEPAKPIDRRHNTTDIRPFPRTERRHNAVDTRK